MDLTAIIQQSGLPVASQFRQISDSLDSGMPLILEAEPGAGKTTLLPLMALHWLQSVGRSHQKVLMLEPRRLAARHAAHFIAGLINEPVGQSIGYRIRNQKTVSASTRIEVVTEGILTRMLQNDPELTGYDVVIFDEFHERNLQSDLGLALAFEAKNALRDDLRIVVMSATLSVESLKPYLEPCQHVVAKGRSYPVQTHFLASRAKTDWRQLFDLACQKALQETTGDLLVFVAGKAEIDWCLRALEQYAEDVQVMPLHTGLPFAEQQKALVPLRNRRKIIVATNLAETSLTIEGVGAVIDSGEVRQAEFDPGWGMDRLFTRRVSRAQATQRAGRAGRLGPGICYRLWSESEPMRDESVAEIERMALTRFALELKLWGVKQVQAFALLQQPPKGHWSHAVEALQSLGLVDVDEQITPLGRRVAAAPLAPHLAAICLGVAKHQQPIACYLSVLLENLHRFSCTRFDVDILSQLRLMADRPASELQQQVQGIWRRVLKNEEPLPKLASLLVKPETAQWLSQCLLRAFPRYLGKRDGDSFLLVSGQRVHVPETYANEQWVIVPSFGGAGRYGTVFAVHPITEEDLDAHLRRHATVNERVFYCEQRNRVVGERVTQLGAICLSVQPISPESQRASACLLEQIKKQGIENLPWDAVLRQTIARLQCWHHHCPDEAPDVNWRKLEAELEKWLAPVLSGKMSLKEIDAECLTQGLSCLLDWPTKNKLDERLPRDWVAPSGRHVVIDYSDPLAPKVSLKLQECFGLSQSPALLRGRLPLTLELLSPAGRPLQVTRDLASFWANGYQAVKKEMKGRYPKHPWPDDPQNAVATALTNKALQQRQP